MELIKKNIFILLSMLFISCTNKYRIPDPTITHYKPSYALLAEQHVASINERNPARRSQILESIYHEDVPYEDLGDEYDLLHGKYPKSMMSIVGKVNLEANILRVKWKMGRPGLPDHSTGENILFLKDEKIKSLYVYIDQHEGGKSNMPRKFVQPKILWSNPGLQFEYQEGA